MSLRKIKITINFYFQKSINFIQKLNWVHNVITILDIPLLSSSDEPLTERLKNYKTLKDDGVDKKRGIKEIINSPVFKEFIIK